MQKGVLSDFDLFKTSKVRMGYAEKYPCRFTSQPEHVAINDKRENSFRKTPSHFVWQ